MMLNLRTCYGKFPRKIIRRAWTIKIDKNNIFKSDKNKCVHVWYRSISLCVHHTLWQMIRKWVTKINFKSYYHNKIQQPESLGFFLSFVGLSWSGCHFLICRTNSWNALSMLMRSFAEVSKNGQLKERANSSPSPDWTSRCVSAISH